MLADVQPVVPFDVQSADDNALDALNEHQNRMHAERLPYDAPVALAVRRAGWRNIDPTIDLRCWVVWSADQRQIVANAWTEAASGEESHAVVNFNIMVLPNYRQRGIGRRLLAAVAAYADAEGRRVLITQTSADRPAAERFMQRIGATRTIGNYSNQLAIADLDGALIRAWINRAIERGQGFELGFWEGAYPQHELQAIAELRAVMNNAPRTSSAIDDALFTADGLRASEQALAARGQVRWSAYVRERATNKLVGFTEVLWHPQCPDLLEQDATGVLPAYRNRGLGRWLKAAMLDKVLRERPMVQLVRTNNADTNAPMLTINRELGFKAYSSDTWWEMDLERVQRYLATR